MTYLQQQLSKCENILVWCVMLRLELETLLLNAYSICVPALDPIYIINSTLQPDSAVRYYSFETSFFSMSERGLFTDW